MQDSNHLEKKVRKKYEQRDKKRRPHMKVSGKSVFTLKKLIERRPIRKNITKKS